MQIGDRVGAFMSATKTDSTITLLGYGIYAGDEVPHELVEGGGPMLRQHNIPNPKIVLDSGKDVFGCECYWADEQAMEEYVSTFNNVVMVDIDDLRRQCREEADHEAD